MKIELLGAIDYAKLKNELKNRNVENVDEIVEYIKELEKWGRADKVSAAGRLSRFAGDVFEVLGLTEENTFDKNTKYIKRVTGMGHDSITDHDYLVFAIKDVSPVIEQTIIAERYSSFTIKSRREADFSNAGFYTPDFHDKNGNVILNNEEAKNEYQNYMQYLFSVYSRLEGMGLPKEDARFILPYCYNSNIIMGVDAHTLKDMIIKYTKTHLSKIQEIREFGEALRRIAEEHIPYIIEEIDKVPYKDEDPVRKVIDDNIDSEEYQVLDGVKLLNSSANIDDTILVSALMGRYQYTAEQAKRLLDSAVAENPNFKEELMHSIVFAGDKHELTQVNFQFHVPLSLAVLTHLTRHRAHELLVPEFAPTVDLSQYKIPPKAKKICPGELEKIFASNIDMYNHFKNDYGIRDEDLVYFTLSGNMVNVVTNMNGKTVEHILALRECSKAQWETQGMARGMHNEISNLEGAELFSSMLGSSCMTQGYCKEGKESCGKIQKLQEAKKKLEITS